MVSWSAAAPFSATACSATGAKSNKRPSNAVLAVAGADFEAK